MSHPKHTPRTSGAGRSMAALNRQRPVSIDAPLPATGRGRLLCLALSLMLGACASLPREDAHQRLGAEHLHARGLDPVQPSTEPARPQGVLAIDEAVRLALAHNPRMRAAYAELGLADASRVLESAWAGPSVSLSALRPNGGGDTELTLGLALGIGELLLLPLRRELAEHEHAAVRAELAARMLELAAEVEQAWYALVAANLQLQVGEREFEAAELRAELAQRFSDAGNLEELALRREQSGLSRARLQRMELLAQRNAAWRALGALIGADPQARWRVHAQLPWVQDDPQDLSALRELAREQRLELEVQRQELARMARVARAGGRAEWLEGLELEAEHEREGSERRNGLGFELELPLPAIVSARRHAKRQAVELGRAQLDQARSQVDLEVGHAHAELVLQASRVRELRERLLPLRAREVELTLLETNFMLLGVWDLMAEQQALFEDWRETFDALGAYWQARVALGHAIGQRLPAAPADTGSLDLDSLARELGQMPNADPHAGHDMGGEASSGEETSLDHSTHAPSDHAHGEQP